MVVAVVVVVLAAIGASVREKVENRFPYLRPFVGPVNSTNVCGKTVHSQKVKEV
jgi:hypothetical protein